MVQEEWWTLAPIDVNVRGTMQAHARMIERSIRKLNTIETFDQESTIISWTKNALYDLVHADYAVAARANGWGGGMLGIAAMNLHSEARLTVLYVNPETSRRGVASRLISLMENTAKAHGHEELRAFSSFLAQRFYLKRGFTHDGEPEKGAGLTWNYPMIKVLGKNV